MVKHCAKLGVQYLTVFAFSTENWRRPEDEVSFLMGLFLQALQKQVRRLHENNMRLKILGSRERFNRQILQGIEEAEALTANNTGLTLSIAADYGGRWDILQAANKLIAEGVSEITEDTLAKHLMLGDAPEPDLFIRTGGETRISNFLLWQMAYAELYFTDILWPIRRNRLGCRRRFVPKTRTAVRTHLRATAYQQQRELNMLKQRVITAMWLLPLMLGMLFYAPQWLWAAFCGLIAMIVLWEYARMGGLCKIKTNHYLAATLVFGVVAYAGGWMLPIWFGMLF